MAGRPTKQDLRSRPHTLWAKREYVFDRSDLVFRPAGTCVEFYDPLQVGYFDLEAVPPGNRQPPLYALLWELDTTNVGTVRDFVSHWGLLGLFQHHLIESRYAASAPRGQSDMSTGPLPARAHPETFLEVTETPLRRDWKPWRTAPPPPRAYTKPDVADHQLGDVHPATVEIDDPRISRQVAKRADAGAQRLEARADWESVRVLHSPHGQVESMPLTDYYARFFPSGRFASMHSKQLWDELAEPLTDIDQAVADLRENYDLCSRAKSERSWKLDRDVREVFDTHLQGVSLTVELAEDRAGRWRAAWAFPSLLSAVYWMLREDFTKPGRRLLYCQRQDCRKPLITDRSDKFFCTGGTCKNTHKSRVRRGTKGEAK